MSLDEQILFEFENSKIEKWSPSPNVYDDLRGMDVLSSPKVPVRSTSTIGYISPYEVEKLQVKRPTVSLILPASRSEQMATMATILSIDDTKRSSSVESLEEETKDLVTNKDDSFVFAENEQSCVCWTVREIIELICVASSGCLLAMFAFTLIFYAFDVYWLKQPIANYSLWWLDNNDTNFTGYDYDGLSATQAIDYDNQY